MGTVVLRLPQLTFRTPEASLKLPLLFCYICLLIVGAMLPSDGGHGLMNPKSLFFLGTFVFATTHLVLAKVLKSSYVFSVIFLCTGVTWLTVAWFVALKDPDSLLAAPFDQFKMFFLTLAVFSLTLYIVRAGIAQTQTIMRVVIIANFCFSLMKVGLLVFHLAGIVNLHTFVARLGIRFMSMNIFAQLVRMQASVDILTPFLLFFVLQSDRIGLRFSKSFKVAYFFIGAFSIFLSFSRFLMGVGAASVMLYALSLSARKQVYFWIAFATLVFAIVAVVGPGTVFKVIEKRFFSSEVADSDEVRVVQSRALLAQFDRFPFMGKGLGSCAPDCIRDLTLTHSYEVQWLAFLMQFGLVGIVLLLAPLFYLLLRFFFPPVSLVSLGFAVLFVFWLISGLTNPFMISLASGMLYALFFLSKECLDQINFSKKYPDPSR